MMFSSFSVCEYYHGQKTAGHCEIHLALRVFSVTLHPDRMGWILDVNYCVLEAVVHAVVSVYFLIINLLF